MEPSPRELIVVAKATAGLRVGTDGITSKEDGEALQQLKDILVGGVRLRPLYGISEDELEERIRDKREVFDESNALRPSLYYRAIGPDEKQESLGEQFRSCKLIAAAYIQPGAEPASVDTGVAARAPFNPSSSTTGSMCDLTHDQAYLQPGEFGINRTAAWNLQGGKGEDVELVDIEGAWYFAHTDLIAKRVLLIGGVATDDEEWRHHGTAVLGLLCGGENGFGITGICPASKVNGCSIFPDPDFVNEPQGVAAAIWRAADCLPEGSVLILEVHLPGPEAAFAANPFQRGYIPAEWWSHVQTAILYATRVRNIIVISAAGNGRVNLDGAIYANRPPTFPTGWKNPFPRNPVDTESIIVGAGAPPNGHHDSFWGPGRSRLAFSNYGKCLDAQAWGAEVTTTGFDSFCGTAEESFYTTEFDGTSSATAIVAGAVACLQGIRKKAAGKPPLTSRQVRQILQETGSPQTDFPGSADEPPRPATEQIGNLPNLAQMIEKMYEF